MLAGVTRVTAHIYPKGYPELIHLVMATWFPGIGQTQTLSKFYVYCCPIVVTWPTPESEWKGTTKGMDKERRMMATILQTIRHGVYFKNKTVSYFTSKGG